MSATFGKNLLAKIQFLKNCFCSFNPSHWHRNIFSQPAAEAEVPADVASEFNFGKPWPISGLVR